MSTLSHDSNGPFFRLYHDVFEDDLFVFGDEVQGPAFVRLEIEGAEFESRHDRVAIRIPAALWEVIRASKAPVKLADVSDGDLWVHAEHMVSGWTRYVEAKPPEHQAACWQHHGLGEADSRAERVRLTYDWLCAQREEQRTVRP